MSSSFKLCLLAMVLPLGLVACSGAAPVMTSESTVAELRLVAINDFHGNLAATGQLKLSDAEGVEHKLAAGGAAYMADLVTVRRDAKAASLVVAAGDLIGASPPISGLFHDEPAIDVLNRMGLQLSSLGNHEFDEGLAELLRMQRGGCHPDLVAGEQTCMDGRFGGASFTYLAANVVDASGRRPFPGSVVKTLRDEHGTPLRVGLIGAVLSETASLVDPQGIAGLSFVDEATAINAELQRLQQRDVDTVVLLIHQGIVTDGDFNDHSCPGAEGPLLDIVDRLDPAIKLVVSGHTHWAYVCERDGRLLTSGGSYARYVTTVDLAIDVKTNRVLELAARNEPVINDLAPNPLQQQWPTRAAEPQIAARVALWDARTKPITSRIVGHASDDLLRPADANHWESTLGNLIADAQLAAMRDPARGGAELALMNPGGIRDSIRVAPVAGEQPGEITWGEVFSAQPFGNVITTVPMTGAAIKAMLESQWSGERPRPLCVSAGLSYRFDSSAPLGARVLADTLQLNGEPVVMQRVYRVAMNSFIANGGDGYTLTVAPGESRVVGPDDLSALLDYLAAHDPLPMPGLDRVRSVN